jgi:C-terminal processing protease CtpA/Prc
MKSFIKLSLIVIALAALIGAVALAKNSRSNQGAWLGVVSQSVDYDLAEAFDLDVKYGVIVNELIDDSPAKASGLEIDDIIVAVDGEEITDYDDLVDLLDDRKEGDKVTISLFRDGEKMDVTVELAKRPRRSYTWNNRSNYRVDMRDSNRSKHAYIGVQLTDLSSQLGEFFGVDKGCGALIREVEEDSPAEKAGLVAGDVIIAIDSDKIRDAGDVVEYISDIDPGENVSVTVVRDKTEVTVEVEVDETTYNSHFGSLHNMYSMPSLPSLPSIDLNLDDLDDLDDLDIRIPNLQSTFRSGLRFKSSRDRNEFQRDMEELRKDLKEMQEELRKEMKDEFNILREMIDN